MKKDSSNTFFYLKIFLLLVALATIGSVIYKITYEITTSKFKENSFTVLYIAKDSKLLFVDKSNKNAFFLALGDMEKFVKGKNPVQASFILGLPINAVITEPNPPSNISDFTSNNYEMKLIFGNKATLKGLNRFDVYKFISSLRSTHEDDRKELRVNIFTPEGLKIIEEEFKDSKIINASYTIQIDNGTTINGLGNELAFILGKVGYNVIAVRTSNDKGNSYVAYDGEKDGYINTLLSLTGFEFEKRKVSPAADITVYLGDDLEALLLP